MRARYARHAPIFLLALCGLLAAGPSRATDYDPPTITSLARGHGKLTVTVKAGPTGAPNGFTLWWMKEADFASNGYQWYPYGNGRQGEAAFTGQPTLNTMNGTITDFALGPDESVTIEIGDLFDETGVQTTSPGELQPGVDYVVTAFSNADVPQSNPGGFSDNLAATTTTSTNCTNTIGFWKTHCGSIYGCKSPDAWPPLPTCALSPGSGLPGVDLGLHCYTKTQLLMILNQPAQGNGLISLAHQLIAAKLNILNGADGSSIASAIATADNMIGSLLIPPIGSDFLDPTSTASLTQTFDDYNNGVTGPGHCAGTALARKTWGELKIRYR